MVVSRQIWLPPFHISVHEQKERGAAEFYLTSSRILTLPVHLAEEVIVLRIPLAVISTGWYEDHWAICYCVHKKLAKSHQSKHERMLAKVKAQANFSSIFFVFFLKPVLDNLIHGPQ